MQTALLIIIMLIGVGLVTFEMFIPGFGAAGITGVILLAVGDLYFWGHYSSGTAIIVTYVVLALIGVCAFVSLRSADKGKMAKSSLFLHKETPAPVQEDLSGLVGQKGKVVSMLRPIGTVEIEGKCMDAYSTGAFIAKDRTVEVTEIRDGKVFVREV